MLEKIKHIMLIFSIGYVCFIVLMVTCNLIMFKSNFVFSYYGNNIQKLDEYENEIIMRNQNSCVNKIKKLIDYSRKTTYVSEVSFKELYYMDMNNPFLFPNIISACDITEEEKEEYDLLLNLLTSMYLSSSIYNEYMYEYVISINDLKNFGNIEKKQLTDVKYKLLKETELRIISELMEIENNRGVN